MGSHPTALAITGNQLLLLTTHDLVRLDLRTKDSPKLLAHHHLVTEPQARLVDMAVVGSHIYVLDAVDNRLICVSLDSGQVVGTLELGPGKGYPYSVAITTDRHQPNQLRILQGPNLRLGAYELGRLGAAAKSGIGKLPSYLGRGLHVVREQMNGARASSPPDASTAPGDAPVGIPDAVAPAPVDPTTPTIGESHTSTGNATADGSGPGSTGTTPPADVTRSNAHGALLRVQVAGEAMTLVAKDALPEAFVPVDVVAYRDGFAVSGVAPGELDVAMLQPNFDTVKLALRFLKDSVQLGKVLYVAPDGNTEILQQGTATYLELATLPDGRLVYSGMRLTGSALPPFVGLGWGVGLQGGHFHTLSKLGVQYLVPPYSYGRVSVQGDQLDTLQ